MCYFLYVKHKKLPFLAVLTWFLILGNFQDCDHFWWRHRPPVAPLPIKYTLSCWEDQRLSTEGKIVSKYCNISKTEGRGSMNPPLLFHGGSMNLRVRSPVNLSCFFFFFRDSAIHRISQRIIQRSESLVRGNSLKGTFRFDIETVEK